jgi:hypothetical protein
MGDVILFRPRTGQSRKIRTSESRTEARIVFFTGVRYERMKEPVAAVGSGDLGAPPEGGLGGTGRGKRRRGA